MIAAAFVTVNCLSRAPPDPAAVTVGHVSRRKRQ
jgi:hypothetical protein